MDLPPSLKRNGPVLIGCAAVLGGIVFIYFYNKSHPNKPVPLPFPAIPGTSGFNIMGGPYTGGGGTVNTGGTSGHPGPQGDPGPTPMPGPMPFPSGNPDPKNYPPVAAAFSPYRGREAGDIPAVLAVNGAKLSMKALR